VHTGALGPLRLVQVECIQGAMASKVEDGPQNNRFRWIFAHGDAGGGGRRKRHPPSRPRIEQGAHTMAFIEACIASHASNGWVDLAKPA